MPKSSGARKKAKNAGVGIDFRKAKHKVGKRLPKARNDTDTNFRSKAISLSDQNIGQDKGSVVSQRNLTLKEMLGQTGHYSPKVRLEALQGLQELFTVHPSELKNQAGTVVEKLANRIADPEKPVRDALKALFQTSLLSAFDGKLLTPFMSLLMAHICSAMTHLHAGIRSDGMQFLEIMMSAAPDLVASEYMLPALQHYSSLLAPASRYNSVSSQSLSSLLKTLSSLQGFLSKASQPQETSQAQASGNSRHAATAAQGVLFAQSCQPVSHSALTQAARALAQMAGQAAGIQVSKAGIVYAELMANLTEAWGECQLTVLDEGNLLQGAQAMEACLQCMQLLQQQKQVNIDSDLQSKTRQALLNKLGPALPVLAPSNRCSPALQQTLMRLNVTGMQLLTSFLDSHWQGNSAGGSVWEKLLDYYTAVLERGEVLPSQAQAADDIQQPPVPAEIYSVIMTGAKKVLPFVSLERRQDLLGAMTTLNKRVTSRSPVKIVVLDFIANIFASPGIFLQPNAGLEPVVSEQEACLWLQSLPRLLWELGGSRPAVSHTALMTLMNAARYTPANNPVAEQLTAMQPALALFYCTELPRNGGKPPGLSGKQTASWALHKSKERGQKMLSQLSKLPEATQVLAVDLLHYMPKLSGSLVSAASLMCSSTLFSPSVLVRLFGVLASRCGEHPEELQVVSGFLRDLLSHPSRQLQTRADAELIAAAACTFARLAGTGHEAQRFEGTVCRWLKPSSTDSVRVAALLAVEAANRATHATNPCIQTGTAALSVSASAEAESHTQDGARAQPSQVRRMLPAALAAALVCHRPRIEGTGSHRKEGLNALLLGVMHSLVLCTPGLMADLLNALPQAAKEARMDLGLADASHAESNLSSKTLNAARSILWALQQEDLRAKLADAENELKCACQSLRQAAESIGQGTESAQRCWATCNQLIGLTLDLRA